MLAGVDGWQAILTGWDPDLVVVEGDDGAGLGARLQGEGWRELYRDDDGRILVPGAESRNDTRSRIDNGLGV